MDKRKKTILIVAGIAVAGIATYLIWRKVKKGKSSFSNAKGNSGRIGGGLGSGGKGQGGRTEQGWGHPSFIKVCEDAGGTYSGDNQGNGECSNLPPSAPNPLPRPIVKESTQSTM